MAVKLYDDALVAKLQKWSKNNNLHIYSPNDTQRLFEVIADESKDKPIELPIACLRRNGGYTISNTGKQPKTFDGFTLEATYERSKQINAIPIEIEYQLDIYTRYLDEADEIARNFIFNIVNFNHLDVEIPYNDSNIIHTATIRVGDRVDDNSDIPERLNFGQFTRFTMYITIDDAYLWDIKYRDNYVIDVSVDAKDIIVKE